MPHRYKESKETYKAVATAKAVADSKRFKAMERDSKRKALEQIAEDRAAFKEKQARNKAAHANAEPAASSQVTGVAAPASAAPTPNPASETTIQIRLPSGHTIKRRFPAGAVVGDLFEFVRTEARAEDRPACAGDFTLLQAFPRRIFGTGELFQTLDEAGLVPNGSLNVLKAVQTPAPVQQAAVSPDATDELETADTDDTDDMDTDAPSVPVLAGDYSYAPLAWGSGRRLGDETVPDEVAAIPVWGITADMDVDSDEENDEDEEHFAGPGQRLGGPSSSPAGRPAAASPVGVPLINNRENRAGLMSQAIAHRFSAAQTPAAPAANSKSRLRKSAKSLKDMCIQTAAGLLTNQKAPHSHLAMLKFLPPDLGELIMKHLMSIRRLDRATLSRLKVCPVQNIVLDSYGLATDSLLETIGRTHWASVTSLSLKGCEYLTDAGIRSLNCLMHLTSLDVSGCRLTDGVVKVISGFHELERLNMSRTKITSEGIRDISLGLRDTLRSLVLTGCPNLNGDRIFQYLQVIGELHFLSLSGAPLSRQQQMPSPGTFQKLRHLDVSRTKIESGVIAGFEALEELDISGCDSIGARDLAALGSGLRRLKSIAFPHRDLEIDGVLEQMCNGSPIEVMNLANFVTLTDFGVFHMAGLKNTLRHLSLIGTKVTDAGLAGIKDCIGLTQLALDRTAVTDAGLIPNLAQLRQLEVLSLSETRTTDQTLLSFPRADFCRILKTLNLSKTDVTDVGVQGGIAALVNLSALNLDFTFVGPGCLSYLHGLKYLQPVRLAGLRELPPDATFTS
ncbi:hypothetical protein HK104_008294 [Borealophlyctis nickersoniae]|nr:hypothetical protein HK104_008294 [Borealophlyctis nickersoniae]